MRRFQAPQYGDELLTEVVRLRLSPRQDQAIREIARQRGIKPAALFRDLIEQLIA